MYPFSLNCLIVFPTESPDLTLIIKYEFFFIIELLNEKFKYDEKIKNIIEIKNIKNFKVFSLLKFVIYFHQLKFLPDSQNHYFDI